MFFIGKTLGVECFLFSNLEKYPSFTDTAIFQLWPLHNGISSKKLCWDWYITRLQRGIRYVYITVPILLSLHVKCSVEICSRAAEYDVKLKLLLVVSLWAEGCLKKWCNLVCWVCTSLQAQTHWEHFWGPGWEESHQVKSLSTQGNETKF